MQALQYEGVVLPEWIDNNGHMNLAYYVVLFDQARQAITRPLFRSRAHRDRDRLRELAPKLKEIQHEHRADLQAQQRDTMEFYAANRVNPLAGCGWLVAGTSINRQSKNARSSARGIA